VKSRIQATLVAAALALPAFAIAGPKLNLPNFDHLKARATEAVDVDVGRPLLALAQHFINKDDPQEAEGLAFIKGLKSVRVRGFTFDQDGAYSQEDIEKVRKQLSGGGWTALAQVHKRDPLEDVDVFMCVEDGKVTGLAVISSEAREFTIVNLVGDIDIDKIGSVEGQFGIPKVSQNTAEAQ
jgi:hypothetical protein